MLNGDTDIGAFHSLISNKDGKMHSNTAALRQHTPT